jgi:hypothetical protein
MPRPTTVVVKGTPKADDSIQQLRVPGGFDRSREGQPLNPRDLASIATQFTPKQQDDISRGKLDPISQSEQLEKAVKHARELKRHQEMGTLDRLWAKGKALYQRVLGIPATTQPPSTTVIDRAISNRVSALKAHHEGELRPVVDAVRATFQGRTFIPDSNTPTVLSLAAVPVAKLGKVITLEALMSGITVMVRNGVRADVTIAPDLGSHRIALVRVSPGGARESLEFSYKRPGKVDVVLNGRVVGNLWNDDAMRAAELFARGQEFTMKRKEPELHVVA